MRETFVHQLNAPPPRRHTYVPSVYIFINSSSGFRNFHFRTETKKASHTLLNCLETRMHSSSRCVPSAAVAVPGVVCLPWGCLPARRRLPAGGCFCPGGVDPPRNRITDTLRTVIRRFKPPPFLLFYALETRIH